MSIRKAVGVALVAPVCLAVLGGLGILFYLASTTEEGLICIGCLIGVVTLTGMALVGWFLLSDERVPPAEEKSVSKIVVVLEIEDEETVLNYADAPDDLICKDIRRGTLGSMFKLGKVERIRG